MVCGDRDEVTLPMLSSLDTRRTRPEAELGHYSWIMPLIFCSHATAQHCMCGFWVRAAQKLLDPGRTALSRMSSAMPISSARL